MKDLKELLENNRTWSKSLKENDPEFFQTLAEHQTPRFLWIGCSDSRVPSTQLVGLMPGDLFVHRNIANVVVHTDFNCLSVLQYAVDALKIKHVMIVGHYGCGGVRAAMERRQLWLIDNWLRHVQDVMHSHEEMLSKITDEEERLNRLCELNVIEQVLNVSRTTSCKARGSEGRRWWCTVGFIVLPMGYYVICESALRARMNCQQHTKPPSKPRERNKAAD
jgi:carbonic anhydrase